MTAPKLPKHLKIVAVGDGGVGKHNLLRAYLNESFIPGWPHYVFEDFNCMRTIDGIGYKLHLHLTNGQEDYDRLRPIGYTQTDVVFICFSIVGGIYYDHTSFENIISKWAPEVIHFMPNTPRLLVGLKADLLNDRGTLDGLSKHGLSPITREQGETLAADIGAVKYVTCSALTKEGLHSLFEEAVRIAVRSQQPKSVLSRFFKGTRNALIEAAQAKETPQDILTKGPKALSAYLEASRYGTKPVYRTRIMLVGQERVGKTSILNSLMGQKFSRSSSITDGVDTTKVCHVPVHKTKSVWHQQRIGKDDRAKQMKDRYVEAMRQNVAQQLLNSDQGASEHESFRSSQGNHLPSVIDASIDSNEESLASASAATDDTDCDSNSKDSKGMLDNIKFLPADYTGISQKELPKEIAKDLAKEVDKQRSSNKKQNEDLSLEFQFWDFAGQDVYYNTHQVFLNRRAIFVLVFDLSKELNEPVQVSQVNFDQTIQMTSRFHDFTGLEFLDFWLQSIYTYAAASKMNRNTNTWMSSRTDSGLGAVQKSTDHETQPYKSPPILIVGTHRRDLRKKATGEENIKAQIFAAIKGKPYEEHVVRRIHFIENNPKRRSKEEEKSISQLRMHISEIALNEPYMGEMIPIRWLQVEGTLAEMAAGKKHYLTLAQVKDVVADNGINDAHEVTAVLQFLHDLGTIIYFGSEEDDTTSNQSLKDLVILDAQWLIDVFKTIITVRPSEKQWATFCNSWRMLGDKGILKESLVNHVWKEHLHLKANLLALMEKFDLLCPRFANHEADNEDQEEMTYYVPSCLQPPQPQQDKASGNATDGSFYFNFFDYLPDGVFNYIVVYTARWSQEKSGIAPKLFHRLGRFTIGAKHNRHSLQIEMLPTRPACIQVALQRKQAYSEDETEDSASPEVCEEVVCFMKETLAELKSKWVGGIRFELSVACVACKHKRSTLHLIKLTQNADDEVYCEFTEDHIQMRAYLKLLGSRQTEPDFTDGEEGVATTMEPSDSSWDSASASFTSNTSSTFMADDLLTSVREKDITFKKVLGHGGFGEVFLATHIHWGDVAIKRVDISDDIMAEAKQMWRTLTSPFLARIMGIIEDPSTPSIVMEFFKYGSLTSFLQYMVSQDVLPRRVRMILDIIQGMNYLHTLPSPIVHRDLKGENVFVAEGFQAKIGDLGLAVSTTSVKSKVKADLAGTITHIPPEAWAGTVTKPTPYFDVYSFGITVYEILSNGKDPWPQTKTFANEGLLSMWVKNGHRPSLDEIPKDTPQALLVLMKKCWTGEPTDRPTFQELQSSFTEMYRSKYEKAINRADRAILDKLSQQAPTSTE